MTTFTFLKAKYDGSEDSDSVFVIDNDRIKTLNLADTYDRFGQLVGHENAGDHHPDNQYSGFEEGDEEILTDCKGFNYFDGNNYKSVITECSTMDDAVTHEVITDPEEIALYTDCINNMQFEKEGSGKKIYESGDFTITESFFASAWETYRIEEL